MSYKHYSFHQQIIIIIWDRLHNRQLPDRMSHLTNCNFAVRMLFCDSYWLYSSSCILSVSVYNCVLTGLELSGGGLNPQFMSTDTHFWVKIGFEFQSLDKIPNISAADPLPPSSFRSIPTLVLTILLKKNLVWLIWFAVRYGQYDPYDRPEASLGYNMDDSGLLNDYNQMYSQPRHTHSGGHSDYYGYGSR